MLSRCSGLTRRIPSIRQPFTASRQISGAAVISVCRQRVISQLASTTSRRLLKPAAAAAALAAAAAVTAECRRPPTVEDNYVLGEQLGEGAFGVVYKAKHKKTGVNVAVKVINKRSGFGDASGATTDEMVRREVAVLERVGMHKNISHLEGFYETEKAFYLVMEFVEGGELFDALVEEGALSEARAALFMKQAADSVAFLHAQGLCHADIKPENLLLTSKKADDASVKLVDFGLTAEVRSQSNSKPGTWAYWPPEAFADEGGIGKATDMWSLGVVLFVMLAGYHPYDPAGEASDETLKRRILYESPDFDDPVWNDVSNEAKSLIKALLEPDLKRRLTIEQLLQEPWLHKGSASSEPLPLAEKRLRRFKQSTASLRAAAFATIIQQRARSGVAEKEALQVSSSRRPWPNMMVGSNMGNMKRRDTRRGRTLEAEVLENAFRAFDPEGKGFITESDLGRVMKGLGHAAGADELHGALHDAAMSDREGKRVLYGDFVEVMSQTDKRRFAQGDTIFKEGDPPDGFLLLLKGSVEVLKQNAYGRNERLATLSAGDHFGENALLSGEPRNATVTCLEEVEVLRLSREDFESGFLQHGGASGPAAAGGLAGAVGAARQTLSFIQMVSAMEKTTLGKGEYAFREGDAGDKFYIIEEGTVTIEAKGKLINRLYDGDCFGEAALIDRKPRNASVRCESAACRLLSLDTSHFSTLLKRSSALQQELGNLGAQRRKSTEEASAATV